MNRRTAMKIAAGALVGAGGSAVALTRAFKPDPPPVDGPKELAYKEAEPGWGYRALDPGTTANLAYHAYDAGGCMYALMHSFVVQLAEKVGEPYASFPTHMMKYGHGGVGGFGTVCGALNGAAALIGLLVEGKETRDALIEELFRWYERTALPVFEPDGAILGFTPPTSVAGSVLCHASTTAWGAVSGRREKSDERKERCRRLTGEVAAKLAVTLNQFAADGTPYTAAHHDDETVRTCMGCHGKEGKLGNTSGKMTCGTCHTESTGHRLFADVHYKLMEKRK